MILHNYQQNSKSVKNLIDNLLRAVGERELGCSRKSFDVQSMEVLSMSRLI